jgi:hypothetical protein
LLALLVAEAAVLHLFELPDEPVRDIYLSEVGHVGRALVVVLGDVVGLDRARVNAERPAGVVDLLLEDSWRGVDVDGGVLYPVFVAQL